MSGQDEWRDVWIFDLKDRELHKVVELLIKQLGMEIVRNYYTGELRVRRIGED